MEFAYKLAAEKIQNNENDKHNDVTLDVLETQPGQNTRKISSGAKILRQLDQVSRRQKHMINLTVLILALLLFSIEVYKSFINSTGKENVTKLK